MSSPDSRGAGDQRLPAPSPFRGRRGGRVGPIPALGRLVLLFPILPLLTVALLLIPVLPRAAGEHQAIRDALERAVKSDPDYPDAWASLSLSYLDEHRFNYNPKPNPLDRAQDAAQRAVATDPTNQNAHNALAQTAVGRPF